MRTTILHKTDIRLNKDKLKEILDSKGLGYIELHEKVSDPNGKFGLDITYKGFMSLLSNRSTWKLIYAHAITDILNISTSDIFDIVKVDTEKLAKEKEEWKEKYQNKKK
jgi:hypothetical protein